MSASIHIQIPSDKFVYIVTITTQRSCDLLRPLPICNQATRQEEEEPSMPDYQQNDLKDDLAQERMPQVNSSGKEKKKTRHLNFFVIMQIHCILIVT